jgi:transcriptional regulator with XRE-family HTH domain
VANRWSMHADYATMVAGWHVLLCPTARALWLGVGRRNNRKLSASRVADASLTTVGNTKDTKMRSKALNSIDKHVGSRVRMRRMMLGMSQTDLGDALRITFQQVQKYERGTNRVSASRLQHISLILQVPVPFFFEGAPLVPGQSTGNGAAPSPVYVTEFLASSEGLALTKAFTRIKQPKMRRRIVDLVEEIAGAHDTREEN